jgi:hypothetical protein
VDEIGWLACEDPEKMVEVLRGQTDGLFFSTTPSERRWRLFAVACCRTVSHWRVRKDLYFDQILDAAEKHADGLLGDKSLRKLTSRTDLMARCLHPGDAINCVTGALNTTRRLDRGSLQYQARILRCVVDNPFQPGSLVHPIQKCPNCKHAGWHGPAEKEPDIVWCSACYEKFVLKPPTFDFLTPEVLNMTRGIYHGAKKGNLDYTAMSVLADLLEENGCTSTALLAHLRSVEFCPGCASGKGPHDDYDCVDGILSNGPHVLGCWAIDTILRKR